MADFTPSGLGQRKNLYSDSKAKMATPGSNTYTTSKGSYAPEQADPKAIGGVYKAKMPKNVISSSATSNVNGGTGQNYATKDTSSLYYTGEAAYQGGSRSNGPAKPQKRASEPRIPMPAMISLGGMMAADEPGYAYGGGVGRMPMGGGFGGARHGFQRDRMPMGGMRNDHGPAYDKGLQTGGELPPVGGSPGGMQGGHHGFGRGLREIGQQIGQNVGDFASRIAAPFMRGGANWANPATGGMQPPPMMPQRPPPMQPPMQPPQQPGANIPPPAYQNFFRR